MSAEEAMAAGAAGGEAGPGAPSSPAAADLPAGTEVTKVYVEYAKSKEIEMQPGDRVDYEVRATAGAYRMVLQLTNPSARLRSARFVGKSSCTVRWPRR